MKTKIILLALVATFTLTLLSSCSALDCEEIEPTEECETIDSCDLEEIREF